MKLVQPFNYNRENRKKFNILLVSKRIELNRGRLIIIQKIQERKRGAAVLINISNYIIIINILLIINRINKFLLIYNYFIIYKVKKNV